MSGLVSRRLPAPPANSEAAASPSPRTFRAVVVERRVKETRVMPHDIRQEWSICAVEIKGARRVILQGVSPEEVKHLPVNARVTITIAPEADHGG